MKEASLRILIVAAAAIFSCTNTKNDKKEQDHQEKNLITEADRIEQGFSGSSVAPQYYRGYSISITPTDLIVTINSYNKVLSTEKRPFTHEKFDKLLHSLENIKAEKEPDNGDIPDGGSTYSITFFKNEKEIFKAHDYGGHAKNYSGADIDLSYLVPDLNDLIEATKKKESEKEN